MEKLTFKMTTKVPSISMGIRNDISKKVVYCEIRRSGIDFYYNHFYYHDLISSESYISLNIKYFERLESFGIDNVVFLSHLNHIFKNLPHLKKKYKGR